MKAKTTVTVTGTADMSQAFTKIELSDGVYTLSVQGAEVATCTRARTLAQWAFDRGAREVNHAYDLREAADE